jgi:hypothetical protein
MGNGPEEDPPISAPSSIFDAVSPASHLASIVAGALGGTGITVDGQEGNAIDVRYGGSKTRILVLNGIEEAV